MKYLIAICVMATTFAVAPAATAQSSPPALPALTQQQMQELDASIDAYRRGTDTRVAGGEITSDEASRLVAWRQWQIAQQIAATSRMAQRAEPSDSDVPPDYYGPRDDAAAPPEYVAPPTRDVYVVPAPAYGPYYYPAPYYPGPRPYAYWGPSVCAGGFGRHFAGRLCF